MPWDTFCCRKNHRERCEDLSKCLSCLYWQEWVLKLKPPLCLFVYPTFSVSWYQSLWWCTFWLLFSIFSTSCSIFTRFIVALFLCVCVHVWLSCVEHTANTSLCDMLLTNWITQTWQLQTWAGFDGKIRFSKPLWRLVFQQGVGFQPLSAQSWGI